MAKLRDSKERLESELMNSMSEIEELHTRIESMSLTSAEQRESLKQKIKTCKSEIKTLKDKLVSKERESDQLKQS